MIVRAGTRTKKLMSRRGGTYARGWRVAGILRMSVLFQGDTCLSSLLFGDKNHMRVAHAAENCQENSAEVRGKTPCFFHYFCTISKVKMSVVTGLRGSFE